MNLLSGGDRRLDIEILPAQADVSHPAPREPQSATGESRLAELRRVLAALETKKLGVVVTGGMAPDACYGYGHGYGVGEEPPVAGYDSLKVPVRVSSHRVGKRQSSSGPHGWYKVAAQACQQSWEICSAQTGELGNVGRGVRGLGPRRGCTAESTARSYVGRCPSVAARQVTRERQYTHARVIAGE